LLMVASTAMATMGSRQAAIVVTKDVNLSIPLI
jgi:hypothetical protein